MEESINVIVGVSEIDDTSNISCFRHCIVRDKATKLEEVKHCTMLLSSLPFPVSLFVFFYFW